MLNWLAELLPLFFVRWYAAKYLARWAINDATIVVTARKGVYIDVTEEYRERRRQRDLEQENESLRLQVDELKALLRSAKGGAS